MIPDELAGYGPFFALETAAGDGWRPFAGDLGDRTAQTQSELERRFDHSVEPQVAASLAHLSLVARLISPALAIAGLTGTVPDLRTANVRWKPRLGGPPPLAVLDATLHPLARFHELVLATVDDMGEALVRSAHIRRGNVASAVASAGRLCPPAAALAAGLLAELEPTSRDPQGFRRTSCCLYYRLDPRAGVCGDCVLVRNA
jgi:hypothetical protein